MELEDYFEVFAPDDIRIKGHRIGIETVLYEYIHRDKCAEDIQHEFPSLTLEQVYATILYYLRDKKRVGRYLADWMAFSHNAREDARRNPPPAIQRLRALQDEINAYPPEEREAARQRIIKRERGQREREGTMIHTIKLTPEQETKLEVAAAAIASDPESFLINLADLLPAEVEKPKTGAEIIERMEREGLFNRNYGDPNLDGPEMARAIREGRWPSPH